VTRISDRGKRSEREGNDNYRHVLEKKKKKVHGAEGRLERKGTFSARAQGQTRKKKKKKEKE